MSFLVALCAAAGPAGSPPTFQNEVPGKLRQAYVGEEFDETFTVADRNPERVEFSAEGLPAGARLHVEEPEPACPCEREDGSSASLRKARIVWTPTRAQRGAHAFSLVASDGRARTRLEVPVTVEERWESWLLPGVQYVAYLPAARGELGAFQGPSFELVVGSWVHRTEDRGPSHGRVYVDLALLDPTKAGGSKAVAYALGMDLSFERNPARRFLIPIFGAEIGGFQQKQLGGFFQTVPFAGAHLFSDRNVFVTATAGYVFPGRDVERLGGWRFRAGLDLALW